jgi:hypothetical protein
MMMDDLISKFPQMKTLPALTSQTRQLEQLCLTSGWTGTVRPKHLPLGWTGLSNQFLGTVAQDQPGPVGQICQTSWLLLRLDSARPTTSQTRLFEHRLNCRVRPVNAGSEDKRMEARRDYKFLEFEPCKQKTEEMRE